MTRYDGSVRRGLPVRVLLDGEPVEKVVEADDELGFVVVLDGFDGVRWRRKLLLGRVEVIYPWVDPDNPPPGLTLRLELPDGMLPRSMHIERDGRLWFGQPRRHPSGVVAFSYVGPYRATPEKDGLPPIELGLGSGMFHEMMDSQEVDAWLSDFKYVE